MRPTSPALGAAFIGALGLMMALTQSGQSAAAPSALRGKLLFLKCASCHDISSMPSAKIGPNLMGVYGRKAGSLPGYSYSPGMKATNFVWNDAMLNRWLTRPTEVVPGTAMAFAGLPNEEDRAAIIAYLRAPKP